MEIKRFLTVEEGLQGNASAECCPQCGSLGVIHFEDPTATEAELPHRCLKCGWAWDGCLFSDGPDLASRLNNILKK